MAVLLSLNKSDENIVKTSTVIDVYLFNHSFTFSELAIVDNHSGVFLPGICCQLM